jgi:hypothetical protein
VIITSGYQLNNDLIIKIIAMEKKDIIILVAVFAALCFSLYRKYIQKNKKKSGSLSGTQPGSSFTSSSKDDDYEPYSKK